MESSSSGVSTRLSAGIAVAAGLLTAGGPFLLGAGGEGQDPRGGLAAALLLASGLATALAAPLVLAGGVRAVALLSGGLVLGALCAALPGGATLEALAALGSLYPLALAALGAAAARLLGRLRAAPLLGMIPPGAFLLSIFAAGPVLSLLGDPGAHLSLLLRGSAVTALSGSLLDIDVLRAAPLYQLVPAASEAPFRYPPFTTTLAAPGFLALALVLGASLRAKSGGASPPKGKQLSLTNAPS